MADFATVADLEAMWRDLTDDETTKATAWLRIASAIVRSRVPSVDDRIAAGTLDADLPRVVVVDMVRRRLETPASGVKSQTVGPYTVSYGDTSAAGLFLTDDELALLTGSATGGLRIGSIGLAAGMGWP